MVLSVGLHVVLILFYHRNNRSRGGVRVMHSNASRGAKQCTAKKSMALSKQD